MITYAGDLYGAANAFCCGTRLTGSIDRCLLIGELLYRGFLRALKILKFGFAKFKPFDGQTFDLLKKMAMSQKAPPRGQLTLLFY